MANCLHQIQSFSYLFLKLHFLRSIKKAVMTLQEKGDIGHYLKKMVLPPCKMIQKRIHHIIFCLNSRPQEFAIICIIFVFNLLLPKTNFTNKPIKSQTLRGQCYSFCTLKISHLFQ